MKSVCSQGDSFTVMILLILLIGKKKKFVYYERGSLSVKMVGSSFSWEISY